MSTEKIVQTNSDSTKGYNSTPPPQSPKPQTGLIPTPPPVNVSPPPPPPPSKGN